MKKSAVRPGSAFFVGPGQLPGTPVRFFLPMLIVRHRCRFHVSVIRWSESLQHGTASATEENIMQEPAASPLRPHAEPFRFTGESEPPFASPGRSRPYHYRSHGRQQASRAEQLAKALGWFSVGLGLAQLLAPRRMSRAIGVEERPGIMRALGVREIVSGAGILSQPRPANWLWTRVAGDAMDLALLGNAARSPYNRRRRIGVALAAVAGVAALDVLAGMENQRRKQHGQGATASGEVRLEKSITINRPPQECYGFWRDFESFPRFMAHVESVRPTEENRLHWTVKGPAGSQVEWDAEILADEPGELLAWRSLAGADVDNAGSVRFETAAGGRGTIVRVAIQYRPPAGAAGEVIAKLFGEEPSQQIDEDLRRFKWLIETGEIPTTVGQPSGARGALNRLLFRKGQPG
jgi:uncharacterized membrane protein